jgi:hypothetical protein
MIRRVQLFLLGLIILTIPSVHHASTNEALDAVLSLPEVKEFRGALDKGGRSKLGAMIERTPSQRRSYYVIKVYESFPDRIVTFNRYRYTPKSGEIAVLDPVSGMWKEAVAAGHCTGERIPQQFSIMVHKNSPKVLLTLFKKIDVEEPDAYDIGCIEVFWGKETTARQILNTLKPMYTGYSNSNKPITFDDVRNEDYNLDGYNDLSILTASGAHGEWARFWLWNPGTQLLEYNADLSRDMNVEVNKDQRAIWSHGAGSVYDSVTNEYLLDHGKVVWVMSIDQQQTYAMSAGAFPVIRKYKIPVKGRMTTVLKLVYEDEEAFKVTCDRCQTLDDLRGCPLLGYGKMRDSASAGAEVLAFEIPKNESICVYYASGSHKSTLGLVPKSSVNLKGD